MDRADEPADAIVLPCVSCGYDLRELPVDGACPECGTSIDRSLGADHLARADAAWLRLVARGQTVFTAGMLLVVIGVFLSITVPITLGITFAAMSMGWPSWLDALADIVVAVPMTGGLLIATAGAFLLTDQEPRERLREPTWSTRRLARGGLLAAIGVIAVDTALEPFVTGAVLRLEEILTLLLLAGAMTVALVAVLVHAGRLAGRIPDPALAGRASELGQQFRWSIPTLAACIVLREPVGLLANSPRIGEVLPILLGLASGGAALLAMGLAIYQIVLFVRLVNLSRALRRAFSTCAAESLREETVPPG